MSNDAYSSLKVFHHQEQLAMLRKTGNSPAPVQVQLIISDLCNQDCGFCAYRMSGYTSNQLFSIGEMASFGHNNPNRMIAREKILEILDDCKEMGVKAIQLTGGGEPSVHPNFIDTLYWIAQRELDTALVTNGVNLKKEAISLLAHAKWVRFSIDAGSEESYCKIRNVSSSHYKKVWKNIEMMVAAKERARNKELQIGIGYVITKENWKEVLDLVRVARLVGVDNVRISALFQSEDEKYFENFFSEASQLCSEATRLSAPGFTVFNLFGDRIGDLTQHSPDYSFCGYQHFNTYIGGDLNVYRCCNTAYNTQGLIGSLKEQSFKQLWESQEKLDKMNSFDAATCERCMFNNKNRTILYALSENPLHVNYV
jgi:radical SAM protein with 4Fe4S-binding SPASM domain